MHRGDRTRTLREGTTRGVKTKEQHERAGFKQARTLPDALRETEPSGQGMQEVEAAACVYVPARQATCEKRTTNPEEK